MENDFLKEKKVAELREIAGVLNIPGYQKLKKAELLALLTKMHEEAMQQEAETQAAEAEKQAPMPTDAALQPQDVPVSADVATQPQDAPVSETEKPEKKPAARKRAASGKTKKAAAEKAETVVKDSKKAAEEKAETVVKDSKKAAEEKAETAEKDSEKTAEENADASAKDPEKTIEDTEKTKKDTKPAKDGRPARDTKLAKVGRKKKEVPQNPGTSEEPAVVSAVISENVPGILTETAPDASASVPETSAETASEPSAASVPGPDAAQTSDKNEPAKNPVNKPGRTEKTGILEIVEGGFGFLRFDNFLTSDEDVYVSPVQIRRFNLKTGDEICCIARKPDPGEKFGALLFVNTVNGDPVGAAIHRTDFSDLTPIYPEERIVMSNGSSARAMRLIDLVAPIGKGQRGLIVAPPKAGKTTLLKQIATAIEAQNANVELIVLLIDERPEEVTDMQRSIGGRVIYSTFDEQPAHHVKVAEMVMARAQRLCEHGKDVVILMDSITRLARAYNLVEAPSGRTLSGGLDPAALFKPKKFFGVARNTEEGGSVTILATALVETGSRMDDVIFEEFKGTGNMELHLDRKLSEKRIFPAINLNKSGTRREDMLMSQEELESVWRMRRSLADFGPQEATEEIIRILAQTKTNAEFIEKYKKVTQ